MSMNPAVSVLVTVYNREAYLGECLDSILRSTWQDFEIVIVDDGSSDGSVALARGYEAKDSRVRLHCNERNLGDYPNRNRAASLARGRYLKYVDADDMIYSHSLRLMVETMEQFPEAALGLSWNVIDPPDPFPIVRSAAEVHRAHFLGKSPLGVGPTAGIIRRSAFEEAGGFSGRQFIGDTELWLKLTSRWPMVSLPPALVWWRRHEGQQMALEVERPEVLTARFKLQEAFLAGSTLLTAEQQGEAEVRRRRFHARRLWSLAIRERRPGAAWRLFRESGLGLMEMLKGLRPAGRSR